MISFFINMARSIYSSKKKIIEKTNKKIVTSPTLKPTVASKKTPGTTLAVNTIEGKKYYVNPDAGNDKLNGLSDKDAFKTIQKAVLLAVAGDTINLMPGTYLQDIITSRDGVRGQPITIKGPRNAIIMGGGNPHVIEINHDNIKLEGFTIDGHFRSTNDKKSYRDKLIYVTGQLPKKGVNYFSMFDMDVKNAGGECIRLRYFVSNSEIARNKITNCGVADFEFNDGGKNGEGIYIGTAPEQRNDKKNPTNDVDQSNGNWIHHNDFNTKGNECVDIKEGSSNNVIEYNNCTGQKDSESGGFDSRGNNNVFKLNTIYDNIGAGIRFGGDGDNDGIGNEATDNVIVNNKAGGIKFQRSPQGKVCGNSMSNNEKGNSVGEFGEDYSPEIACN